MSMMREKQFEACERRLFAHPGVGLFAPEATEADAQALLAGSFDDVGGKSRHTLATLEGLRAAVKNAKAVVVLEGNAGMMCSDIRLFLEGTKPVYFHGRMGGSMVNTDSVKPKVKHILENKKDWSELNGKEVIWTAYDA